MAVALAKRIRRPQHEAVFSRDDGHVIGAAASHHIDFDFVTRVLGVPARAFFFFETCMTLAIRGNVTDKVCTVEGAPNCTRTRNRREKICEADCFGYQLRSLLKPVKKLRDRPRKT
ncbi:hypothetical protein MRX96_046718 [Rhipicephalus microplus]